MRETESKEKKCDQTKSACLKCSTSNGQWKGYRKKETIFINCAVLEEFKPQNRTEPLTGSRTPPSTPNRLKPELVGRDHFLSLFLRDYLPKHQNVAIYDHQRGLFWARYMPEETNKSKTLSESLAAVSLAVVARVNSDGGLIKHGFEIYVNALQEARKALASPVSRSSQDPLASLMALATYELWQPTYKSGHGWRYHVSGA